ncbi:MAG: 4Fe-4S dicluster domain-containing protein [Planctomycetota bacterium]
MKNKIQMTVDGMPCEADEGAMLLSVLREMGIHVPTLCHHPSLEPSGACRLCVVEITHADWKGWSGLVTSCLYPVEPGLIVSTMSPKVRLARQTLLELYMAQCPDSEEIRVLARSQGVDETPFPAKALADKCVMCGLCFRVCQDLGPSAIASLRRGTEKTVGPRPDRVGDDCTGCTACAHICPTGEIRMERKNGKLHIWNRTFDIPVCSVNAERCRGCGVCEEVCPLAIPRVVLFRNGARVARIAAEPCVGCGLCAGVCPTGAIEQPLFPADELCGRALDQGDLRGRTITFACSRSPLPEAPGVVIPVPCVGRVTAENVLECLARGADGVMLMCRDRASCPTGRGGDLGSKRVEAISELVFSAGLGAGRVVFAHPHAGLEGPAAAVAGFKESLKPSVLRKTYAGSASHATGMDHALEIMRWLRSRPELVPMMPASLLPLLCRNREGADALLYLGDLVDLDLLLSLVVHEKRLVSIFEDAVRLLELKGIAFEPVFTTRQVEASPIAKVITFCSCCAPKLNGEKESLSLDALAGVAAAQAVKPSECGFTFRMTAKEQKERSAAQVDGSLHSYTCPYALARQWDRMRMGSWQGAFSVEPIMAFSQSIRASAGEVKS